jgi:hypothetical protein
MKLIVLFITLMISLPSLGQSHSLSYGPDLKVPQVSVRNPIQTNLIRLYMRMPSERRMIAGVKEKRSGWLDGLRERLKGTSGKMRI